MATNTKIRAELKKFFVKNAIPTEGNFADLIDGQLNQRDDGVFRQAGQPLAVVAANGDQQSVLQLYASFPATNPDWLISLNPKNPVNSTVNMPGFGIADGAGNTRLVLDTLGNLTVAGTTSLTGNGAILKLCGADHAYIEFLPRGEAASRQAWIGYGNPGTTDLWVASDGGDLWLWGKQKVVVKNDLQAEGNVSVTGNGNVGIGTDKPRARLEIAAGALMPAVGNNDSSGILFPKEPGGGSGDAAWIRYFVNAGESTTLQIGVSNDVDDSLQLKSSGRVQVDAPSTALSGSVSIGNYLQLATHVQDLDNIAGGFPEGLYEMLRAADANQVCLFATRYIGNLMGQSPFKLSAYVRDQDGDWHYCDLATQFKKVGPVL